MTTACPRCGTLHLSGAPCLSLSLPLAAPASELRTGDVLAGRYHIIRTIHRGGMSAVYLVEDALRQRRQLALKELRLTEGASPEDIQEAEAWFARESFLLSVLQHPLIPAFYSVFREDGRSYIVQEYVAGENLDDLVRRQGPVEETLVVEWAQALCGLLGYLHSLPEPVIFRDLKPANILLREAGWGRTPSGIMPLSGTSRLAVVDFGIARPFRQGQINTVVGTPGYAPPEQYQGLASPQSDVYALGATLHRLLTGFNPEKPAPGERAFTFPPVRQLNPGISEGLAAIVTRAVQLDPAARYADAAALSEALRGLSRRGFTGRGVIAGRWSPNSSVPISRADWLTACVTGARAILAPLAVLGVMALPLLTLAPKMFLMEQSPVMLDCSTPIFGMSVTRPMLDLTFDGTTHSGLLPGDLISLVVAGGPSAQAGVLPGDKVISAAPAQWLSAQSQQAPAQWSLTLQRAGQTITLQVRPTTPCTP